MAQDIRDLFSAEEDPTTGEKLNKGHQKRFEARLQKELPQERRSHNNFYLKISAIFIVALGIGLFYFNSGSYGPAENQIVTVPSEDKIEETGTVQKQFQLSDISPEFKKIENYYMAGINMELAKLEVNNDNKALIDAFMLEMEELDKEYQRLNAELNESGPNEQTIEAMIANLQLRMDLLRKLKTKLNEIKQSKNKSHEKLQA
ncbi:hypothetical protein FK178_08715 [Antarcticibacterium arcticum]|uniref:Anti-sigma factor n=1 Tax=Antarcticibacterium arcticum TaxID=2585771 RepID=A0A5B8YPI2_9FLAO|nr:hypothetical protein [Antarcticibacterium arcticum]QED37799.1 hypothetical protein FK178_08715 [Antarcticibacterium arcticum]